MVQGAETQGRCAARPASSSRKRLLSANTNELVERARQKGALYHHFANKKELYQAVVEDMEQELVERLEAAGAGRRGTAVRHVQRVRRRMPRARASAHAGAGSARSTRLENLVQPRAAI